MVHLPATEPTTTSRPWAPSKSSIPNPKWTEEKIADLKRLYEAGYSGGKIAAELGFSSRSAVIGKISRLGLNGRKYSYHTPKASRSKKISRGLQEYKLKQRIKAIHKHRYREPLLEVVPILSPSEFDQAIPINQRRTILELTDQTCRWPVGELNSKNFFFCGGPAYLIGGQPYCKHHAARAHQRGYGA